MKKLMISALKEAARAAVSAFLAALGLAASVSATLCASRSVTPVGLKLTTQILIRLHHPFCRRRTNQSRPPFFLL